MAGAEAAAASFTDVACPFCGLVCDDLVVEAGDGLRVVAGGCPISIPAFARPAGEPQARVQGRHAETGAALDAAAAILGNSRLPLYAGLGTDLAGMRAVIALAERTGGILDHMGSDTLFASLLAQQAVGWVTTTLSEVRNRVDLLLVVGGGIETGFPRFFERCVVGAATLFDGDPGRPEIIVLGPAEAPAIAGIERPRRAIACPAERLPEALALLRACVEGRASGTAGDGLGEELRELALRMRAARYGVVVWAAGALPARHGELLVQTLAQLVASLNRSTRFACLPLGGSDNGIGANQVCTWQSGLPLRTSFASGQPALDPYHHATRRLLEDGAVDALLWLSSFRDAEPPAADVPTIVLGPPAMAPAREPEVFLPVGTPGLDHAGTVYRCDSVVALPLRRLRASGLASAASVIQAIASRLEA